MDRLEDEAAAVGWEDSWPGPTPLGPGLGCCNRAQQLSFRRTTVWSADGQLPHTAVLFKQDIKTLCTCAIAGNQEKDTHHAGPACVTLMFLVT